MERYNSAFSWIFLFLVAIFSGFNMYLSRIEQIRRLEYYNKSIQNYSSYI